MKNTYLFVTIVLGFILQINFAEAAPIPGTSSSAKMAPKLGVHRSALGFEMKTAGTGFKQVAVPSDNKYIESVFQNINGGSKAGTLTVRVDKLEKATSLKRYVQRWEKEYPKYGFDLLGSKAFTQSGTQGYVLDLINRKTNRQLRQVIFMNEPKKSAVILTCRDNTKQFSATLKGCNEIIRSFAWKR